MASRSSCPQRSASNLPLKCGGLRYRFHRTSRRARRTAAADGTDTTSGSRWARGPNSSRISNCLRSSNWLTQPNVWHGALVGQTGQLLHGLLRSLRTKTVAQAVSLFCLGAIRPVSLVALARASLDSFSMSRGLPVYLCRPPCTAQGSRCCSCSSLLLVTFAMQKRNLRMTNRHREPANPRAREPRQHRESIANRRTANREPRKI